MQDKYVSRFWTKVSKTDKCWPWIGTITNQGYGQFWDGKRLYRAHVFMMIISGNEIPQDKIVCHHCDNPLCVNPEHLYIGTHRQNMQDRLKRGRAKGLFKHGYDERRGKLTPDQVLEIRAKYRPKVYTQRMLASEFGISDRMVFDIIHRKFWSFI